MTYFEDIAINGELDEVVKYLSGFTKLDDNKCSRSMFFKIRKQKYLEALDRGDKAKAVEILMELKCFFEFDDFDDTNFKDLTHLLTQDFSLKKQDSREVMLEKLKTSVLKNPLFHDKLQFPNLDYSRLGTLINQSLKCQHNMCISPKPNPDIKTLFMDHSCGPPNVNCATSAVTKNIGFFTDGPRIDTSASSSNTRINFGIADGRAQLVPDTRPNRDTQFLPYVKSRVTDESQKSKIWQLTETNHPCRLRALRLSDSLSPERVVKLMYTHAGSAIIALTNNAMHKVWKWEKNERNLNGKATSAVPPQWLPSNGIMMSNDIKKINKENALPCFALSKDDVYLLSASGGMVSSFMMQSFELVNKCCLPPPAATCLAFHPKDNNIIAIGMDDFSILVYDINSAMVKNKLTNHQQIVTGLAFSIVLNVLVSSGADAQLCVWSLDGWEKQASKFLKPKTMSPTCVHFHQDQIHVLAVQRTQITVYKAPTLEHLGQSFLAGPTGTIIMDAVYSCEGQSIYAALADGSVAVLNATSLKLKQRIILGEIIPSNSRSRIYAVAVAAHPSQPHQFALGLSNGVVVVFDLMEAEASSRYLKMLLNLASFPVHR